MSEFYRPKHIFGFVYRQRRVHRRRGETRFKVPWGVGGEDWLLGDRRPRGASDVVARLSNGVLVQLELVVNKGLIECLRVVKGWSTSGQLLPRHPRWSSWRDVEALLFFDGANPSSVSETRLHVNERRFSPPELLGRLTGWATWLVSMENTRIPAGKAREGEYQMRLPPSVRRALPATANEIEELQQRHKIYLPDELREFWLVSNGLSYFGISVCGTYDTHLLDWQCGPRLLLVPEIYGDGSVIAVEVYRENKLPTKTARILQYGPGVREPMCEWASLNECFAHLLGEAKKQVASVG